MRKDSRRFAVVPGHVFPETERVVAGNERYEVVEKFGEAVEVTDAADRRELGRRASQRLGHALSHASPSASSRSAKTTA